MKHLLTAFALLLALPAFAQQGHPLAGTWQGEWGSGGDDGHFLTLIMDWDGQTITGIANPGPDSTPIERMVLDASDWSVDIDMQVKDGNGRTQLFQAEGHMEDLGSQTRSLKGTWQGDGQRGTFALTRQSGP